MNEDLTPENQRPLGGKSHLIVIDEAGPISRDEMQKLIDMKCRYNGPHCMIATIFMSDAFGSNVHRKEEDVKDGI